MTFCSNWHDIRVFVMSDRKQYFECVSVMRALGHELASQHKLLMTDYSQVHLNLIELLI